MAFSESPSASEMVVLYLRTSENVPAGTDIGSLPSSTVRARPFLSSCFPILCTHTSSGVRGRNRIRSVGAKTYENSIYIAAGSADCPRVSYRGAWIIRSFRPMRKVPFASDSPVSLTAVQLRCTSAGCAAQAVANARIPQADRKNLRSIHASFTISQLVLGTRPAPEGRESSSQRVHPTYDRRGYQGPFGDCLAGVGFVLTLSYSTSIVPRRA